MLLRAALIISFIIKMLVEFSYFGEFVNIITVTIPLSAKVVGSVIYIAPCVYIHNGTIMSLIIFLQSQLKHQEIVSKAF